MICNRLRGSPPLGVALATLLATTLIAGCGNNSGKTDAVQARADAEGGPEPDPGESAAAREQKPRGKKKSAERGGRIGEIPLDAWPEVWFKEPLAVAAEKGPTEAQPAPSAESPEPRPTAQANVASANPAKTERESGAGKAPDSSWAGVISGEDILEESKTIRNSLTQKLQDVGRYSSTYKDLRVDASVLTALAGVAIEHPDSPSWKPNAKYIRDAASEIAKSSTANGEKFFKPARKAYDRLDALFSGSKPPDVEEAADKVKFSEVANRYYLMQRMRRIGDWMKSEINSEGAFKKQGEKLAHEAAILALLAKVIETPEYPDFDNEEYRGYADAVSQAGLDIGQAVKNGDFNAFTAALDSCNKSCNKCHMAFKDSN